MLYSYYLLSYYLDYNIENCVIKNMFPYTYKFNKYYLKQNIPIPKVINWIDYNDIYN